MFIMCSLCEINHRLNKRKKTAAIWTFVNVVSVPLFDVPPLYATRRCSQTSPFWISNHLIHKTSEMAEEANKTSSHRCKTCRFLSTISRHLEASEEPRIGVFQ